MHWLFAVHGILGILKMMVLALPSASSRIFDFFHKYAQLTLSGGVTRTNNNSKVSELETAAEEVAKDPDDDPATGGLSSQAQELVSELSARNADVLAHEAAHLAAAGAYAEGGATYTYQTGPDGKQYAIGGEVNVDMSPVVGDPRATIAKMVAIRSAALAPADPSPQDLAVAATAERIEAQAQAQLNQELSSLATGSKNGISSLYTKTPSLLGLFISAEA